MKKTSILLLLLLCLMIASDHSIAQTFEVGHTSINFYDSERDREVPTEIYYPTETEGEDVPVANGEHPVVIFGHGFLMSWDAYDNFWTALVPQGYILCFPTTEMSLLPNHEAFALDFSFIKEQMQIENGETSSLFLNAVAPETVFMGHSMGGGASCLAAANEADLTGLVNFAAAETNPSAISASQMITAPTLMYSGGDDCVTPPEDHQDPIYENLGTECKTIIEIIDGGHCYFANESFTCNLGEATCNFNLNITAEVQQAIAFTYLNLWLEYAVQGDEASFDTFNTALSEDNDILFMQSCGSNHIPVESEGLDLVVFPNPTESILQVNTTGTLTNTSKRYVIMNSQGQVVQEGSLTSNQLTLNLSHLPDGAYCIKTAQGNFASAARFIKIH